MKAVLIIIFLGAIIKGNTQIMNPYEINNLNPNKYADGINPKRFQNLKGDIFSITHFEFDIEKGKDDMKFLHSTNCYSIKFNRKKKVIEELSFSEPDVIRSITKFTDFRNDRTHSIKYLDLNGNVQREERYAYDKFGVLCSEEIVINGDTSKKIYILDNSSNIRKGRWDECYYDQNGILFKSVSSNIDNYQTLFRYHDNGTIKSVVTIENSDTTRIEEFDESGFLTKLVHNEYKNGGLFRSSIYVHTYDANLKLQTEEKFFISGKSNSQKIIYKYNLNKRLSEVYRIRDGIKKLLADYQYNEQGDLIYKEFERDITKIEYHDYDEKGNWLAKTTYFNDKLFRYYTRRIKYQKNKS